MLPGFSLERNLPSACRSRPSYAVVRGRNSTTGGQLPHGRVVRAATPSWRYSAKGIIVKRKAQTPNQA